jgi:hypothetical protein
LFGNSKGASLRDNESLTLARKGAELWIVDATTSS